jgi:hypothetical protein
MRRLAAMILFATVTMVSACDAQQASLPTSTASQQSATAEQLYRAGIDAYAKSHLLEAASAFERAVFLDPQNILYLGALTLTQVRLNEMHDPAASRRGPSGLQGETGPAEEPVSVRFDAPVEFHPEGRRISVHSTGPAMELLRDCLSSFGIHTTFDSSVTTNSIIHLDLEDAPFEEVRNALELATKTFLVPVGAHVAVIYRDTPENREHFEPRAYETVDLPFFRAEDVVGIQTLARNLLDIPEVTIVKEQQRIALRGPTSRLVAFNAMLRDIFAGAGQVLLDVRLFQLDSTRIRNIGLQLPQQASVFNVDSEAEKLISDNQSIVNAAVAAGYVSANDTIGILELLVAAGYANNSLLSEGFALFGGGLTWSGLAFGATTLNMALNSSDTRQRDDVELLVMDKDTATFRVGERYPIETSQYSYSIATSSTSGTTSITPQVQYEDLGLTLSATPTMLMEDHLSLQFDLKLRTLSGSSLNKIPILNNRQLAGSIVLRSGETVAVISSVTEQDTKGLEGIAGLSNVPAVQSATSDSDREKDLDAIVLLVTPHVVRKPRAADMSPLIVLSRGQEEKP